MKKQLLDKSDKLMNIWSTYKSIKIFSQYNRKSSLLVSDNLFWALFLKSSKVGVHTSGLMSLTVNTFLASSSPISSVRSSVVLPNVQTMEISWMYLSVKKEQTLLDVFCL